MKYTARFVFYYYDEFNVTFCNIYDITIRENSPLEAIKSAEKIVKLASRHYDAPNNIYFISLTDEKGAIYVLSKNQPVILPEECYEKLPKSFCKNKEIFFRAVLA